MKDWPSEHDEHLTRMGCFGWTVVGIITLGHVSAVGLLVLKWLT